MSVLGNKFFPDLAQTCFAFLESDYGFSVTRIQLGSVEQRKPASIEWESNVARLRILFDNSLIYIDIGPITNPPSEKPWYDLGHIINFTEGHRAFKYHADVLARRHDLEKALGEELQELASLVKCYCDGMLRGDFSILPQLAAWLDSGGARAR
jgi:hypothetical protein